jgi:hypothetical protein
VKGWPDNYIFREGKAALIEWKATEYKREPIPGKSWPNASIEATQYAFHYYLASCGVIMIYAYYDKFYNIEKGFLLEAGNPFSVVSSKIRFPIRADLNLDTKNKQIEFLKYVFSEKVCFNPKTIGNNRSPDPYLLIMSEKLQELKHWHELLP